MQTNFVADRFGGWVSDFHLNEELPFITKSALIDLKELEDFITTIKGQQADSVRIYFLRFRPDDVPTPQILAEDGQVVKGCKWLDAPNGFTQAGIAFVPAKNYNRDKNFIFSADDIVINDEITTLMPGILTEGTALNPPGTSGKGKP